MSTAVPWGHLLGSACIGLVWGWLLGNLPYRSCRLVQDALAAGLATVLWVAELFLLVGARPLIPFLVSTGLALWVHAGWRRELARRSGPVM